MPAASTERGYLALGANLGDAHTALQAAIDSIDALPGTSVRAASGVWRSAPVDAVGPDFLNAVVAIDTRLAALDLLQALHDIEARAGRVRSSHHAPRPLDLDLLALGAQVHATPALTVPHPRLHQRAFVLLPLLEVAPDLRLPGLGTVRAHLAATRDQRIERLDHLRLRIPGPDDPR